MLKLLRFRSYPLVPDSTLELNIEVEDTAAKLRDNSFDADQVS